MAHWQYQQRAAPPPGAFTGPNPSPVELDRWYQPLAGPRFTRARPTEGSFVVEPIAPIPPPTIPDSSMWFRPLAEPVLPRRQTATGFTVEPLEPSLFRDRIPDISTWFRQQPGPWPRTMPAREGFLIEPPGGALFSDLHVRPPSILHHFTYTLTMRVRETLTGGGVVLSEGFAADTRRLGPTTDPIADRCSYSTQVIAGGGSTNVDFSALHGTQIDFNAQGRSIKYLFVRNRGAHNLSVGPAAATPLEPFGPGNTPQFPPGATVSLYLPGGVPVNGLAYLLKLTGTAAEESELAVVVG